MAAHIDDATLQTKVRALSALTSVDEIRRNLVDISTILVPYFCWWPWLEPFLIVNCFTTVPTDENGHFQTTLWYPCVLGAPNIYLKAQQLHGMVWDWIYRPSIYCNTHWSYSCGTEIVINVTNPSAIPCAPEDPVDPPVGVGTWVMPSAVGGTYIWGTPPLAPPAPAGRLGEVEWPHRLWWVHRCALRQLLGVPPRLVHQHPKRRHQVLPLAIPEIGHVGLVRHVRGRCAALRQTAARGAAHVSRVSTGSPYRRRKCESVRIQAPAAPRTGSERSSRNDHVLADGRLFRGHLPRLSRYTSIAAQHSRGGRAIPDQARGVQSGLARR